MDIIVNVNKAYTAVRHIHITQAAGPGSLLPGTRHYHPTQADWGEGGVKEG